MILPASAQTEHEFHMDLLYAACVHKDPMRVIRVLQDWHLVCAEDRVSCTEMEDRIQDAEARLRDAKSTVGALQDELDHAEDRVDKLQKALNVYNALEKDPDG